MIFFFIALPFFVFTLAPHSSLILLPSPKSSTKDMLASDIHEKLVKACHYFDPDTVHALLSQEPMLILLIKMDVLLFTGL